MRQKQGEDARNRVLSATSLLGKGVSFLDVGCGNGKLTMEFANRLGLSHIYGVDNDSKRLVEAKNRGVITERVDLNKDVLPFQDNYFDIVLCHQVAEHIVNVDCLLQEIWRVLKPDGKLVISVPNLCSLHNRLFMLFGYQPTVISPSSKFSFGNPALNGEQLEEEVGHRHNNAFSPAAFKGILKYYKFNVKYYWGSGIYFLPEYILKLFPGLGVVQIAIARKAIHV